MPQGGPAARKRLDLLVANLVGRPGTGFGSETNEAAIVAADGEDVAMARRTKAELARLVLDRVAALLDEPRATGVRPGG